ncbi:unnamed protein product [Mytilus coruscus]|uniref:YqaJ viral recombinase domain-containing protein n=1 Tax=Mytilus coruscus TaxID=42192 RepID=A0A6J8B3J1_MYTCO|nr:unnamed protein product [Mytilus coruscus]
MVTGSTVYSAIGLDSLKAEQRHYDEVVRGKPKEIPSDEVQKRMDHGTRNEINAIATLVSVVLHTFYSAMTFHEEGCYIIDNQGAKFCVVSPDGGLRMNARPVIAVEIKCPSPQNFNSEEPYSRVSVRYVLQIMMVMFVLKVFTAILVCWMPKTTTVLDVPFSQAIWEKMWKKMINIYSPERLKRPTSLHSDLKDLKADLHEFVDLQSCSVGFTSKAGYECMPCPQDTFGFRCAENCQCDQKERCDNVHGCVPRHYSYNLSTKNSFTMINRSQSAFSLSEMTSQLPEKNSHKRKRTQRLGEIMGSIENADLGVDVPDIDIPLPSSSNSNTNFYQLSGNSQCNTVQNLNTASSNPNVPYTDIESNDDQVRKILTVATPIITQTVVTILKSTGVIQGKDANTTDLTLTPALTDQSQSVNSMLPSTQSNTTFNTTGIPVTQLKYDRKPIM